MKYRYLLLAMALASSTILVGCNKSDAPAAAAAGQQMPPAVVNVMPVTFESVPLVKSLAGRTVAYQQAIVLPQVTGILDQQLFQDGAMVKQGQPLYRINPDNYTSALGASQAQLEQSNAAIGTAEANLNNAKATLQSALAQQMLAEANFKRLETLKNVAVELDEKKKPFSAISQQEYEIGAANVKTAQAAVENARAQIGVMTANKNAAIAAAKGVAQNVKGNQLNINRTIVRAPISGRTGRSVINVGGLVTVGQTQLNTISRDDTMYVDINQSANELLELQKQAAQGKLQAPHSNDVRLTLQDGTLYPITGQLSFEEQKVDPTTGAVTIRATFKNNGLLIPGMYVNAQITQGVINNAVLLPQSAVNRTPKGDVTVYVVDANNKIQVRPITVAGTYQGKWIVTGGLQQGESVVIIGGAKVKPDQQVVAKPVTSDMLAASAPAGTPAVPSNAPVNPTAASASSATPTSQAIAQAPAAPATEKTTTTQTTTTTTVAPVASSTKQ